MYTIGEFAAVGRVSVRMLRHYDSIGLLVPARVDDRTGYRRYSNEQVPRLLRIVELRHLDVGLDRIAEVFAAQDEDEAVRLTLLERRQEIEAMIDHETALLTRIDRRLRQLEGTALMSTPVSYRPLDAITVYAVSGVAPGMGPDHVGPVVGPLIEQLDTALEAARRPILPPAVFWYEPIDDGERLVVNVSQTAEPDPRAGDGYGVVELPAVALAATVLHHGDMTGIGDTWTALVEQLVADGYRLAGANREVYLHAPGHVPGPDWVTEVQVPVERV
ncbi:MerR family transcriptional regulator [Glaciibacter flavus]|uniref:MerR family transcriptional regulator n=1 Tax=Orlajensenia flava TaxID=2565934 RepID=A0A4S4FYD4_9MICO|nr:MerR family transcriptional regulator [Glaciibacter flavus]THG35458.1 MerR family transcriptional regulator [Glaciibacter flavus]